MRATTAFNKMLAIPGANVATVTFTPAGVVVGLRPRSRRLTCSCGFKTRAAYDSSVRRWRHLDLGACRLVLESEIRRLHCRRCERVRTEQVPWARPGARHTRDFEDVVERAPGRQGVHGVIVSAVLGHASPAFTIAVYQHAWQEGPYEAAAALEKALASASSGVGNPLANELLDASSQRVSVAN